MKQGMQRSLRIAVLDPQGPNGPYQAMQVRSMVLLSYCEPLEAR